MASVSRLAWALLALALLGASASLFGPAEHQWGVDIGSAGAALFASTLWTGAWLLGKNPDRVFSPAWPIAERRAWAGLLFVLLIFLNFARFMWDLSHHAPPSSVGDMPSRHFVWNLVVLLIGWAVVSKTIGTVHDDAVEYDERDRRIQRTAERAGDLALTLTVLATVVLLATVAAQRLSWWLAPLIAANALLGLLIVPSLVEHSYLVARYARERG